MKYKRLTVFAAILQCAFANIGFAQSAVDPAHQITISGISADKKLASQIDYFVSTSDGMVKLNVGYRTRGTAIKTTADQDELIFYVPNQGVDGSSSYREVYRLPVPKGAAAQLLLVFTSKKQIPLLLDDSLQSHPVGSVRMVNLSSQPLIGMVGEDRFTLEPLSNSISAVNGNGLFPIRLAVSHDGQWRPIKSITARIRNGGRILCLGRFVTSEDETYFDMTPITDRPQI